MSAHRPSSRLLLTAMNGLWDPTDPFVQVLRSAWLLASMPDWYAPSAIVNRRSTRIESGESALISLGVDLEQLARTALIDRIATELDGDKACALSIAKLADAFAAVEHAKNTDQRPDGPLDALGRARGDYESEFEQARIA